MGNEASRPTVYHHISRALPPYSQYGNDERHEWASKGVKAFSSEGDREQFIYSLISLMTSNGSINLECHQFKLLFSRRQEAIPSPTSPPAPGPSKPSWKCLGSLTPAPEPDDGTRLVATLVAIDERGVIKVKIEPQDAGRDVPEAFRAFKREVELRLERLLRDVPDGGGKAPGHAVDNGRATVQRDREMVQPTVRRADRDLADAPPAYGDVKKG